MTCNVKLQLSVIASYLGTVDMSCARVSRTNAKSTRRYQRHRTLRASGEIIGKAVRGFLCTEYSVRSSLYGAFCQARSIRTTSAERKVDSLGTAGMTCIWAKTQEAPRSPRPSPHHARRVKVCSCTLSAQTTNLTLKLVSSQRQRIRLARTRPRSN